MLHQVLQRLREEVGDTAVTATESVVAEVFEVSELL